MSTEPSEAREALATIREQIAQVRQANERTRTDHAAYQESVRQADEDRARAARNGELGPEWRRIQVRMDAGQTNLGRVFAGQDDSPEAQVLLRRVVERSAGMREQLEEYLEESEAPDPVFAENRRVAGELQAAMERLAELNRTLRGGTPGT